jgi:hypothetical protein
MLVIVGDASYALAVCCNSTPVKTLGLARVEEHLEADVFNVIEHETSRGTAVHLFSFLI